MQSVATSRAVTPTTTRHRFYARLSFEETFWGWAFILPAVLGLLIFKVGPVLASLALSFTKYEIISTPSWVGLANYTKLLNDDLWIKSVQVTLRYVGLFVPSALITAYAIALLMSRNLRGINFYRTVWYLPSVVPAVASATIWRWGLHPEFGPINYPLKVLGLPAPRWLTDPDWIIPSIVFISLWGLGNTVLIFLASIKGVPATFYEAAEVDGANAWERFRHVTLPLTSSIIFYQLIVNVIGSFQVFGVAYVLFVSNPSASSAGPDNAALFYVLYMFRNAFGYFRNGYASAMAWVLFVVIMVLTGLLFYSQRRWVYYETEGAGS
ncbi:MAG: sugar ABC transporter permease [Caldilineaceae bacterium]